MIPPRKNRNLKRLPTAYYLGQAYVHWSMTMQNRSNGWLNKKFHSEFREIMIHTTFRFDMICPAYCCMPDHFHILLIGLHPNSNQLKAISFLRTKINYYFKNTAFKLQVQPYEHVLKESEREKFAFENTAHYISQNPRRANLIPEHDLQDYEFTGCIVPGYPELKFHQEDYWLRFWRVFSYLTDGNGKNFLKTDN